MAGVEVRLVLPEGSIEDLHQNASTSSYQQEFPWPATGSSDQVLQDQADPRVQQTYALDGHLLIELSEEPDATAATTTIQVDGQSHSWVLEDDRCTLKSSTPLAAGEHTVTITTSALDLSGRGLAEPFSQTFSLETVSGSGHVYAAVDPKSVPLSVLSNTFGYHGRPLQVEAGLIYFRNRYYDPEIGRFISADPLGYVDGPSQYAFAGNDPLNSTDPMGLNKGTPEEQRQVREHLARSRALDQRLAFEYRGAVVQAVRRAFPEGADEREALAGFFSRGGVGPQRVANQVIQYLGPAGTCGSSPLEQIACSVSDISPEMDLIELATVESAGLLLGAGGGRGLASPYLWREITLKGAFRSRALGNIARSRAARMSSSFLEYARTDRARWAGVPRGTARFIARASGEILDTSRIVVPGPRDSAFGKVDFLLGRVPGSAKSAGRGGTFARTLGFTDSRLEASLRTHLVENFGSAAIQGNRITVTAPLTGPAGATRGVRSVWQVLDDGAVELITAFERNVGR